MKTTLALICVLFFGAAMFTLGGCETSTPGVTNTLGALDAHLDSTPDKVTKAARKACEELKLAEIASAGTKIDGKVTARTATGEAVEISIGLAGENVSSIHIRVGTTGDMAVSKQIFDRTKDNLHWF